MQLPNILNSKGTTSVIQLSVTNKANTTKQAYFLFNPDDNWFEAENATSSDVLGHFSGSLMHTIEQDTEAVLMQCTAFQVTGGIVKKGTSFCPMVRDGETFKSCIIYKDGSIEII